MRVGLSQTSSVTDVNWAGWEAVVLPEGPDLGWTDQRARLDALPVPVTDSQGEGRRARPAIGPRPA